MKNKEIVKQVIQAFLDANIEDAVSYMADDVKMGWPGFFDLEPGKDAVKKFFKDIPEMTSGSIGDLIEEGDKVVDTGMVTSKKDGSLQNSFFCDVYTLENGKVKEIRSYMVFEQKKETA